VPFSCLLLVNFGHPVPGPADSAPDLCCGLARVDRRGFGEVTRRFRVVNGGFPGGRTRFRTDGQVVGALSTSVPTPSISPWRLHRRPLPFL
jgi:hypothetical protein